MFRMKPKKLHLGQEWQQTCMNNGVFYESRNILSYNRVGKEIIINPEQSKTVRMIYGLYFPEMGITTVLMSLKSGAPYCERKGNVVCFLYLAHVEELLLLREYNLS